MMHVVASVLGRFGGNRVTARPGTFNPLAPDFWAPLSDAGSGAVNTTLLRGTGPATFTRATAAACRLSTGLWKLDVASGTARSHYYEFSPGVMTYGGYLAETAATQLCLLPRDMTNAAWTKGATMTVAQTGIGIDGVANSCTRLTAGAVEATNTVLQTLTAAASSRTYSAFIKRVTGTGTVAITQDGVAYTDITAQLNTTSFVQVQLSASQLNAVFGIRMTTSTDVILVDCNQFEAGAFATTPIPAAGTRNADVLTYPIDGNGDVAQGTCYAELALTTGGNIGTVRRAVAFGTGVGDYPLGLVTASVTTVILASDSTNNPQKTGLTDMQTGIRKRASSWGGAGMAVTGDGAAVATSAFDGALGASPIGIGARTNGNTPWLGTLQDVRIWKVQASNAQLSGITS